MEEIKYVDRIPEPPKDLVQWLKDKGCFTKNWLIYQCGWETEVMTGIKSKCLDVVCTACGEHFKAVRDEDIDLGVGCGCGYGGSYYSQYCGRAGDSIIKDSQKTKCPICGEEVECMHVHRVGREEMGTEWPLVLTRDGENLIAAAYRVMRVVDKQGVSKYLVQKYEAYVFTPKKAYWLCGWHPGGFGIKCLIGAWEQRKRCIDQLGSCDLIYTAGKDVFRGTSLENSKFYRYMKSGHEKRFPISYLLFYKKHPQIENLLVQGYGWLVSEAIRGQADPNGSQFAAEAVNWKEVSPRKMIGLSKPDFEVLKGKEIKSRDIVSFRKLRKTDPSMNPQEVSNLVQTFAYSLDEIVKFGQSAGKIARYCVKQAGKSEQKEKQAPSNAFISWQDYISMAKKLRYNLKEESVKFPPHLYAAHDRAVMATKYKENEALKEQFRAMLTGYKNSLIKMLTAYASAPNETAKGQYKQQIQALSNLVTLYTVGTDSSITSEPQFEAKLLQLSTQSANNKNIVSSGSKITAGASQLSSVSQKVSAQFSDGGTFKSGMQQVANGVSKLNQNSEKLASLQTGIGKLTGALSQFKTGSDKLLAGSQKLESGLVLAQSGSSQLLSGSNQLADANTKIKDGTAQLASGVGLVGQTSEIQNVVNKVKTDKDDKVAGAFDQTFLLSAIILMLASICGLFTDRKNDQKDIPSI